MNKEENAIDSNGVFIEDRNNYAGFVGIPYSTLYKYIHLDEEKRKILGNGRRGPHRLVEDEHCQFVAESLARRDRCYNDFSRKEAINIIMDIQPISPGRKR